MATKDLNQEISAVQMEVKALAWKRIKEALEADEYNDEARLAKDALSVLDKQRQTDGAREQSRFLMVASFADDKEKRKYVESTQPEIRKLLTEGQKGS